MLEVELFPHYHSFLSTADPEKVYEIIATVPSENALKILQMNNESIEKRIEQLNPGSFGCREYLTEVLMNLFIGGIEKTMKLKKEKYFVFAKKRNDGGWSGLRTPRIHLYEKGKVDLRDLILNSHNNEVFYNAGFNSVYLPPAEVLKEEDVPIFSIEDEWEAKGKLLQTFDRFFCQSIVEKHHVNIE